MLPVMDNDWSWCVEHCSWCSAADSHAWMKLWSVSLVYDATRCYIRVDWQADTQLLKLSERDSPYLKAHFNGIVLPLCFRQLHSTVTSSIQVQGCWLLELVGVSSYLLKANHMYLISHHLYSGGCTCHLAEKFPCSLLPKDIEIQLSKCIILTLILVLV